MLVSEFSAPVDIANRALQHLGAQRIVSFDDVSKNASEIASCYDKIRTSELRRNVWRFATRRALLRSVVPTFTSATPTTPALLPTFIISPGPYNAGVVYFPGELTVDTNGTVWQGRTDNNLGNTPGTTDDWDLFFGPLTVQPYDTTGKTSYYAAEHVYLSPFPGAIEVYTSLVTGNMDSPPVSTPYSLLTAYRKGQVVKGSNNWFYMSLIDVNLGNDPTLAPVQWQTNITYAQGAVVMGLDSRLYISLINGNLGANPTGGGFPNAWTTTGPALWTSSFVGGTGSLLWHRQANAAVKGISWLSPLTSGPDATQSIRQVFHLPAGFLRQAPDDGKQGNVSYLGAPSGRMPDDYMWEGQYLTSTLAGPIMLRFVADMTLVRQMDPMFCEGLAARIALETCETITQSTEKWQKCNSEYKRIMGEARIVNGIETGPVQPPEDEYISCRL